MVQAVGTGVLVGEEMLRTTKIFENVGKLGIFKRTQMEQKW